MECHVDVGAKMVVLDRQGRWCATLTPPDNWAAFYHWTEISQGMKEPYTQSGHGFETFADPAEMQWAIDAWEANAPPVPPPIPEPEEEKPTDSPTPPEPAPPPDPPPDPLVP
jgi:hypothetical protein